MRQLLLALVCLVLYSLYVPVTHAQQDAAVKDLPHVDDCNYCTKCHVTTKPQPWSKRRVRALETVAKRETLKWRGRLYNWMRSYHTYRIDYNPFLFMPVNQLHKAGKPNCTECRGCNTELSPLNVSQTFLGSDFYRPEIGSAQNWVYKASTSRTSNGFAAVKIWCIPVPKVGRKPYDCWPLQVSERLQLLLALQRVRDDCGFQDIVPAMWLDPVNAVMPGTGYHIQWYALWMELAPGISFEAILRNAAEPQVPRAVMANFLSERMNKSQVARAALFDLLTMQCDRHQQNILVDESGNLHLIDNEIMFKAVWVHCAQDSMLLPGTSKYTASHLGIAYVLKQRNGTVAPNNPRLAVHPAVILDYRCYVANGTIGRELPPRVGKCLASMGRMSPQQLMQRYGLPDEETAGALKTRAEDLLQRGFEYALYRGQPQNRAPQSFRPQPPCCSLGASNNSFRCGHSYQPHYELPYGNTVTGSAWSKDFPDPGSYNGTEELLKIDVQVSVTGGT